MSIMQETITMGLMRILKQEIDWLNAWDPSQNERICKKKRQATVCRANNDAAERAMINKNIPKNTEGLQMILASLKPCPEGFLHVN